MMLYGAVDLHSNNSVVNIIDEQERVVYEKRLPNDLPFILGQLSPYQSSLEGIVVESTYNWYWLVDGLMDAGYTVHLANTAAIQQYEGIKYTDDRSDARWLAQMLRLGLLPEGYIYPKEQRAVRDLLRKRSQLVRQNTTNLLRVGNLVSRNTGSSLSANRIKQLRPETAGSLFGNADHVLAVQANLSVMRCLEEQIQILERAIRDRIKLKADLGYLKTVPGIGKTLALTIMLETGDIRRFPQVGNFASYCRCVDSRKVSNGKRKGSGNSKNGNKYLAWAFVEAANFAVRFDPQIRRYYQRKKAKTKGVVAIKAVAHKLTRACYYIMRDQVPFDVAKAFA